MLRKILVVDDSEINRKILIKMLSEDYDVLEAIDGQAAFEILRESSQEISAVLLDLDMPVMDGYELLKIMRKDMNIANIPVIVVTGSTEPEAEEKSFLFGANDFVVKPYKPRVVKHRLINTIKLREDAAIINAVKRDALTGLYNREAFFIEAKEMIYKQPSGYYVMASFNIDNFKVINDQFGNEKGDYVLKYVADTFQKGFGRIGGICSRVSADKFAVLYPHSFMNTGAIADIRSQAAELDGSMPEISFSIGRYIIDDLDLTVSAMYDRASIAEASVKGRFDVNIAQYDEAMREHILHQQEIINEMKNALETGQFEVWLQPQYNHCSGALIGSEALVRWNHPKRGIISPGEFIPVFENNGFIYEMDKYVLEQVCMLLRRWIYEERSPLPVSVNLSRYDLFRKDLFEVLTGLVSRYNIPVELLRLEVTESVFAKSTKQIIDVVQELVDYGFTVEVDDFGSGYSSLNTLKDVPADILKLDMRFLEDSNSSRGGNILESIVRMAKWLGMPVIAEGVETKEQADYLKSIGCYYIQGYYYAKPMKIGDYETIAAGIGKEEKMFSLETAEALDNDAFWDPKSMETLIFNSYIGGACILEYHDGNIEILRVNDKYAEVLGGESNMSVEDAMGIDWVDYLSEKDILQLKQEIHRAINTRDEVACELIFTGLPGCCEKTYLRAFMRVIASTAGSYLIYCINENITDQREAEQKLRETDEQLRFLNDTANDLLKHADVGIESVLEKVLDYFGGSRAYIYEYDYENNTCINTCEVCAEGSVPYMKRYTKFPLDIASFWLQTFRTSRFMYIEDVKGVGVERMLEREVLETLKVKSSLAVALKAGDKIIGTMGVFDPTKHLTDFDNLGALGDYMAAILSRRDFDSCSSENEELLLVKDTAQEVNNALAEMGKMILSFNIRENTLTIPKAYADRYGIPEVYTNVADAVIKAGSLNESVQAAYRALYADIIGGRQSGSTEWRIQSKDKSWHWEKCEFVTIFTEAGKPERAVIFVEDTTKQHEKDDEIRAVKENESIFRMVADHSDRLIYRYDIASHTAYACSPIGIKNIARAKAANLPESSIENGLVLPESADDYRTMYHDIHAGKKEGNAKIHMCYDGDVPKWVDMKYSLITDDDNSPKIAIISYLDVTEEHEKELAYERYRREVDDSNSEEGLVYFETDLTADVVERCGGNIPDLSFPETGCTHMEAVNYGIDNFVIEGERERVRKMFSRENLLNCFKAEQTRLTDNMPVCLPEIGACWFNAEIDMVEDPFSGHIKVYILLRDVTKEAIAAMNVQRQAEIDGMTGLYNKTKSEALIKEKLLAADGRPCTLLIADLDNLKTINDSKGHGYGDKAIKTFAGAFKSQFRNTDVVGRIGGDEFIAFIDGDSNEVRIRRKLSAIMKNLSTIYLTEDADSALHGSVGAVMSTVGSESYDELFQKADKALYHVKRNGKNDYAVYTSDMEESFYEYKGHENVSWKITMFDEDELDYLLKAVSTIYPLVISANLTKNSYYIMQYENFATTSYIDSGVYDELVMEGKNSFHEEERESFEKTFAREALLAAYSRGEKSVTHVGRQLGDDGIYRRIRSDVIFVQSQSSDDVLQITLARELSDKNKPDSSFGQQI